MSVSDAEIYGIQTILCVGCLKKPRKYGKVRKMIHLRT